MKIERKVGSFKARRPNGDIVQIDEYHEFTGASHQGCVHEDWEPEIKLFKLRDGGPVSFINEKTFEVVATGERLTIP